MHIFDVRITEVPLSFCPFWRTELEALPGGAWVVLILPVQTPGKEEFWKHYTSFTETDPANM